MARKPQNVSPTTGTSARSLAQWIELAAIIALVVANLGMTSSMFVLLFENDVALTGGVQLAIVAGYGVVAFRRGHIIPLVIALALVLYFIGATIMFGEITGSPVNINASLTYLTLLLFLPLCETRLPWGLVLRIILIACGVYSTLYVVLNAYILEAAVDKVRLVLSSDGERDRRVFLAFHWALALVLWGLFTLRQRSLWGAAAMAIGIVAIFIAHSRLYSLLGLAVVAAAAITMWKPTVRPFLVWGFAAVFVILSLITLWGYADPNWNAYKFIANDNSGTARFYEFQDAAQAIKGYEFFGLGIAPSGDDLQYFIRPTRPFFASDLGTAGVLFQFGIAGTLAFAAWTIRLMTLIPHAAVRETPASQAVSWTVVHAGLAGFFATGLLGATATLFGAAVMALWLRGGYFSFRPPAAGMSQADPSMTNLRMYGL